MDDAQTSNMYLAAALVAYGGEILAVDHSNINRQIFKFKSLPDKVWVISGNPPTIVQQNVQSVNDVKVLMTNEKLMFPPNFVNAVIAVKSHLYME